MEFKGGVARGRADGHLTVQTEPACKPPPESNGDARKNADYGLPFLLRAHRAHISGIEIQQIRPRSFSCSITQSGIADSGKVERRVGALLTLSGAETAGRLPRSRGGDGVCGEEGCCHRLWVNVQGILAARDHDAVGDGAETS